MRKLGRKWLFYSPPEKIFQKHQLAYKEDQENSSSRNNFGEEAPSFAIAKKYKNNTFLSSDNSSPVQVFRWESYQT